MTASTIVSDPGGYFWNELSLTVTVYQYHDIVDRDEVALKVALLARSHCSEIPLHADAVESIQFFIDKDSGGSNLAAQTIRIDRSEPEWTSGIGVDQPPNTVWDPPEMLAWWIDTIVTAVGCFVPEIQIAHTMATILINGATAFLPDPTYWEDAERSDTYAWSKWWNPGYDFGNVDLIEQYAANTIMWRQDMVNPTTYYGIKISALVDYCFDYVTPTIEVGPIYLQIGQNPDYVGQLDVDSTRVDSALWIDGYWRGTTNGDPFLVQTGLHTVEVQDVVYIRKRIGPHKWTAKKYVFECWVDSGAPKYNNPAEYYVGVDGAHLTAVYYFAGTVSP